MSDTTVIEVTKQSDGLLKKIRRRTQFRVRVTQMLLWATKNYSSWKN